MNFFKLLKEIYKRLINRFLFKRPDFSENRIFLQGKILQEKNKDKNKINNLKDVEFSVFSQFGDDGIISWVVNQIPNIKKKFVEIGTQDYWESNTRFLLKSENWSGILVDSSEKDIRKIKQQRIYWQHNLKAYQLMITKENINQFLTDQISAKDKDIGLLSIDIDGNDYWILEEINSIDPTIVVCEFNSIFGDIHKISVLYEKNFVRNKLHYSNLYFGASIKALISLMEKKGYFYIGTNSSGINAFFIKKHLSAKFKTKIQEIKTFPSKVRECLDKNGKLTYEDIFERKKRIENLKIYDFDENKVKLLNEYKTLYTDNWVES